jgi:NitT/TauT family transport system substrate-binding protein
MRIALFLLLTVPFGITLSACYQASSIPPELPAPKLLSPNTVATVKPLQKLKVAFTNQPQGTLVHVAIAKGFFKAEGLDVEPLIFPFGKAALEAVLAHKADIATAAETPIMFNILNGEKIVVIANIVASNMNNGIVARRNVGINDGRDLRGKRVGVTIGTTSDFFLSSFLTAKGLTRSQIKEVPLKPDEMREALHTKKVDAVSTWNYTLSQISRELGPNGISFFDREIYTETFNLVSKKDFAENNPAVVASFLRALIKAEEQVVKMPDEAQAIMAADTKVSQALVREVWNGFQFHVGLDEILLITLEDETRWAIGNKRTTQTQMPKFLSYIYFDGLNTVRPSSVRIRK